MNASQYFVSRIPSIRVVSAMTTSRLSPSPPHRSTSPHVCVHADSVHPELG